MESDNEFKQLDAFDEAYIKRLAADVAAIKYAQEQQDLGVVRKKPQLLQAILVGLHDAGVLSAGCCVPLQILRARFPKAATLKDLPHQALEQFLFAVDSFPDDEYDEWPSSVVLAVKVYNARHLKSWTLTRGPTGGVTVRDTHALCHKLSSVPSCRQVLRVTASYRRTLHKGQLNIEIHCA